MSLKNALQEEFARQDKTFDRVKNTGLILFDTVIAALSTIKEYEEAGSKQHKRTLDKVAQILRDTAYKLPSKYD